MGAGMPIPGTGNILQLSVGMCGEFPCITIQINWIQVFTDIIEGLIELFSGRPRDEATQQTAQCAMGSRAPYARLYGLILQRMLNEWDIVTSAGGEDARKLLDLAFGQAVNGAVAMGYPRRNAADSLLWLLSRDGQNCGARPAILTEPPPQPTQMWGDQKLQDIHDQAVGLAEARGLRHEAFDRFVERFVWQKTPLGHLFSVQFIRQDGIPPFPCGKDQEWNYDFSICVPRPQHGECPPGYTYNKHTESCDPIVPPGPEGCPADSIWSDKWQHCLPLRDKKGKCPKGYTWNAQTSLCEPNIPPPPPPCPAGFQWNFDYSQCAPIPQKQNCPSGYVYNSVSGQCDPLGPPGGGTEEECCQAVVMQLQAIAQTLASIAQEIPQGDTTNCCASIVSALGALTTQVGAIVNLLATPPPESTPIDLTPVVNALNSFGACICELPGIVTDQTAQLTGALGEIAKAIQNMEPADINQIAAQLKRRNDDLQVPEDWKTQLINSGAVPQDLVPLLQGTTWDTVVGGAAHTIGWALGLGLSEAEAVVERIFDWLIKPVAGILWKIFTELISGFELGAGFSPTKIAHAARAVVKAIDSAVTTIFGGAATKVLEGYESGIKKLDLTSEAGVNLALEKFMGRALELGMGAHILATLPELAYFTKQLGLNATAALLAELAGFHEVMIQAHRPFMTATLGRPATYVNNRKFPTLLPAHNLALNYWARRKLHDKDLDYLLDSAGADRRFRLPMRAAAYRPISARAITTAIQDTPFPTDELRDILRDNAFSDEHAEFLLGLLRYNSTKNVRNSYISEAIRAYEQGVMSDDELNAILAGVGWSDEAKQFVTSRALLARRLKLASEVEKQIVPLLANGDISPDDALAQLEAAGLQEWAARLQVTLGTTRATIKQARLDATAERKLELERQRTGTRALIERFKKGELSEADLLAGLLALGVDTLVAGYLALGVVTQAKQHLRWAFGQLLSQEEAAVLEGRVAAIAQQVKDQLRTFESARSELALFHVPEAQINELLAQWAAKLKKSPGAAIELDPVTGRPVRSIAPPG